MFARLMAAKPSSGLRLEKSGRFDLRADAGAHRPARRRGPIQEVGVAGLRVAVDQQHRHVGGQIDRAIAVVVGRHGVAFQPGGDLVRAGRLENCTWNRSLAVLPGGISGNVTAGRPWPSSPRTTDTSLAGVVPKFAPPPP